MGFAMNGFGAGGGGFGPQGMPAGGMQRSPFAGQSFQMGGPMQGNWGQRPMQAPMQMQQNPWGGGQPMQRPNMGMGFPQGGFGMGMNRPQPSPYGQGGGALNLNMQAGGARANYAQGGPSAAQMQSFLGAFGGRR